MKDTGHKRELNPGSSGAGSPACTADIPWTARRVSRIEELRDAVLGSGLDAVQMTSGQIAASLAFAQRRGITITSGMIGGDVAFRGALSDHGVSVGLGLRIPPGSQQWHEPVSTGNVGIYRAGDEHDSLHRTGSSYVVATFSPQQLEEEAAALGLVLDLATVGGTRILPHPIDSGRLTRVLHALERVHVAAAGPVDLDPFDTLIRLMIVHCARRPRRSAGRARPSRHARVVALAREFIVANLHEPIRIEEIARAASTSPRTLHRAFLERLGEPPQAHVRRLRLHRIRHELASDAEAACTIALVANQWGIGEPGRLSGWYRALFGELPSQTVARRRADALQQDATGPHLAGSA